MILKMLSFLLAYLSIATIVHSYTSPSFFGNSIRPARTSHNRASLQFGNGINRYQCNNCVSRKSALYMGMKINIRIVGRKSSEPWLEEGVAMYEQRLRPSNVEVDTTWHKDNVALMKGVEMDRSKNHKVVCLDPMGKQQTSEKFADKVYQWLDEGGSRLSFIIGGAEGLPPELKYPSYDSGKKGKKKNNDAPTLISLGEITLTHQMARLILVEQVYRSTEIKKGSGYHK